MGWRVEQDRMLSNRCPMLVVALQTVDPSVWAGVLPAHWGGALSRMTQAVRDTTSAMWPPTPCDAAPLCTVEAALVRWRQANFSASAMLHMLRLCMYLWLHVTRQRGW
jgi:hypothetical protein